jgi:nucleotide-binding universal stress UspA family protein
MTDDAVTASQTRKLTRVLVATDFSPTAETAVDWAIDIARRHGATLHLVHGLTLPAPLPDYVPAGAGFGQELHEIAVGRLTETAARAEKAGLEIELEVPIGVPSQVIVRAAEEHDVGLVVIGTRGLTGLAHLLLGSTAERVVQRAPCPVLSIHPGDIDKHGPIRTILVPTDFSPAAEEAARVAVALLCAGGEAAKLILLHTFHLPIEYTAYGPIPTSAHYIEDAGKNAEANLERAAAGLRRDGLTVETVAREGYAPEAIVDAAQQHRVDLVAMGTHGRTGLAHLLLGSTAERVVQHADCPVLTVRLR